jgi:hypothetical protein
MAHKAGHIEDWYKDKGMGGSWEDSPDGKGIGDTWYLPDTKDDIPLIEDFPEEKKPSKKYDWLPGVWDYFTDDFLEDVGGVGDVLGDMEWGKIGINSLLNAPEQLLDLATFWPQMGYQGGKWFSGGDFDWPLYNKPWLPYEESNKYKIGKGMTAEEGSQEALETLAAFPLYRWLYNKAPKAAQSFASKWMPWVHGVSTQAASKPGSGLMKNLARNMVWSPGTGWSLAKGLPLGAATAGLTTLLYSPPAGARSDIGEDREWEPWMEHSTSRFDLDNPNEMKNFEPRVIRSQDKQRGPGPWNEFKG